ncbi:MAG: hypothetical protein ACR2PT_06320 [Endozoicomonas sp.]
MMGYKALLTLDLDSGVSSVNKRQKLYDYLKNEKWSKLSSLTTAWTCSFTDNVTHDNAIRTIKIDVANAARYAEAINYDAAVQIGKGDVVEF